MPYPLPLTRTEAYLAYKAGVIQQSDLKPSLAVPRNGIDAWLAYWTGLAADYPKREDGTPHILQEEEAYIAYLSGVINEYPEKCLRRVGAYLRYLISARWGRPDHPLNREELYLSLIKTQFIPSGDPSSDIEIDGTAKAAFVDVKMYGDTYQQRYTGKNLFNYLLPSSPITRNGLTLTSNPDGSITVNGTISDNFTIVSGDAQRVDITSLLEDGATYTISQAEGKNGFVAIEVVANKPDNSKTYYNLFNFDSRQFTVNFSTFSSYTICILTGTTSAWGGESREFTIYPMLEKSPTATSFEPYVGGLPSPNPDYPQTVHTVTGLQSVEVQGKNLNRFPYASGSSRTHRGVTFTANPDGSVTIKGTHDGSGTAIYYFRDFWNYNEAKGVIVDANTTITASITGGDGYGIRFIAEGYYSDETYDQFSTTNTQTITTTAEATFNGRITVYAGFSSEDGVTVYPMIEAGSTATKFVPYSKQTHEINLGKNLFDKDNARIYALNPTTNGSVLSPLTNACSTFIPITGGDTFTVSTTNRSLLDQYASVYFISGTPDTATTWITRTQFGQNSSITVTAPAGATYLGMYFLYSNNQTTIANAEATIQIEMGSTATPYAPYFKPIELCKTGLNYTYSDTIAKDDDGDWSVIREVGIVNAKNASYTKVGNCFQSTGEFPTDRVANSSTRMTNFTYNSVTTNISSLLANGEFGFNTSGRLTLRIDSVQTAEDLTTWLNNNDSVIYYHLSTPTSTKITDTNLIAQLDALVNGGSEEGTTYIKVSATDPNLPGLLVVEAPKYE